MTKQHLITPPPELVQEWVNTYFGGKISQSNFHSDLATRAAQWGSDQELEACCALLQQKGVPAWSLLRMHRRPKPSSLKEQALLAIDTAVADDRLSADVANVVRRALEQLDD